MLFFDNISTISCAIASPVKRIFLFLIFAKNVILARFGILLSTKSSSPIKVSLVIFFFDDHLFHFSRSLSTFFFVGPSKKILIFLRRTDLILSSTAIILSKSVLIGIFSILANFVRS